MIGLDDPALAAFLVNETGYWMDAETALGSFAKMPFVDQKVPDDFRRALIANYGNRPIWKRSSARRRNIPGEKKSPRLPLDNPRRDIVRLARPDRDYGPRHDAARLQALDRKRIRCVSPAGQRVQIAHQARWVPLRGNLSCFRLLIADRSPIDTTSPLYKWMKVDDIS